MKAEAAQLFAEGLSIIVPVCERNDPVEQIYKETVEALKGVAPGMEMIFVLDGPAQSIRAQLAQLKDSSVPIRIVHLGGWAGEAASIMIGVEHSRYDKILLLPPYRQVESSSLREFVESLGDNDLLVGRRRPRKDSYFNQAATSAYSSILRRISGRNFDDLGCSVRLLRRRVFDEIILYGDQHRFLPLLAQQRGFRVESADLPQHKGDAQARLYGPGVYMRRVLDLFAVFFLLKFTKKPLRFFGMIGSALVGLGGLVLVLAVIQRQWFGMDLADRPILIFGVLLCSLGVQLLALGLIGELLIFTHAKDQKEYTVAELVNFDD